MKNNTKKGFTIVELVIVIAVIAILSAVLIPTFSSVVKKAEESAMESEVATARTILLTEIEVDGLQEGANYYIYYKKDKTSGWYKLNGNNLDKVENNTKPTTIGAGDTVWYKTTLTTDITGIETENQKTNTNISSNIFIVKDVTSV